MAIDAPTGLQLSATEILDAIALLRERDAEDRAYDLARLWEDDPDEALSSALERLSPAA